MLSNSLQLQSNINHIMILSVRSSVTIKSPQFTPIITRVHPRPSGAVKSITEVLTVHQTPKYSAESE